MKSRFWKIFSLLSLLSLSLLISLDAVKANSNPVQLSPEVSASMIDGGSVHTCALTTSGGVKCWGFNGFGQLGDGGKGKRCPVVGAPCQLAPVDVSGLSSGIRAIAMGGYHTCALTMGGGVKCWGNNLYGQLGDGTTTQRNKPVNVIGLGSGVTAITAGWEHTCALITTGGVKCWGGNWVGQLGDGTTMYRFTPVNVSGLTSDVTAIASDHTHTCALTVSGGAKCWGENDYGQLGDGTTTNRLTPVNVTGLTTGVIAIAIGASHTCALRSSGGVKCWGMNFFGQLGDGTTTDQHMPVNVNGLTTGVSAIAVGQYHSCALTTRGGLKCWGNNEHGQIGDGTTKHRHTPVNVSGLTSGVSEIGEGWWFSCATTTNGGAKCWGSNDFGQIGDGTGSDRHTPVSVVGFGSGSSDIDLSIKSVVPVQVLEGHELVKNKATAVKVVVRKKGNNAVNNIDVKISYGAFSSGRFFVAEASNMNDVHALKDDNTRYPLNFASDESTKAIYFFSDDLTPTEDVFQASVTVDPANAVNESDETNNVKSSQMLEVHQTNWSGLLFPDMYIHYFRTDWGSVPLTNFMSYYEASNEFMKGVYPLTEQSYQPNKSDNFVGDTSLFRGEDGKLNTAELGLWALATAPQLRLAHPTADSLIATVPSGWFSENTIGINAVGAAFRFPLTPVILAESGSTRLNSTDPATIAHEVGHIYGLNLDCEDYDSNCDGISDRIGSPASAGLWVKKRIPMHSLGERAIYSFMGADSSDEYWAEAGAYSTLLLDHKSLVSQSSASQIGSQGILVVGSFHDDGTVSLDNWYLLPETDFSALKPGPYVFEYEDANGGTLHTESFDVSFTVEGNTLSESPFVLTIPHIPGTAKIVIKKDGMPLDEKLVTAHAPTISLNSPNGGEQIAEQTTVQWSGNDDDSDSLSYSLLYSTDNGGNWEAITSNVVTESYSWDVSTLPNGNQYIIKVVGTDGFNTAEDLSDAPFAIANPCNSKPTKPNLAKPKQGGISKKLKVSLDWNDAPCANTYTIIVREGSKKGPKVQTQKNLTLSQFKTKALTSGKTYFWRVVATNDYGNTKSAWWSFTVK